MSEDTTNGQSGLNPRTVASLSGLGGAVAGGLGGLFAAAQADSSAFTTGILTMVASVVVSVLTAGGALLVAYFNNSKKLHEEIGNLRQQIREDNRKCDEEIGKLRDQIGVVRDKSIEETGKLKLALSDSLLRERDLKYDLERAQKRIEVLESSVGIVHPQVLFGVILADFNGVIEEFSPSLTAALGWTPEQMRGESIEKLIPPDMVQSHRAKFNEWTKSSTVIDPTKKINTYALDKYGKRVPITVSLRKWTGDRQLITATIVIRPSAAAGTLPEGTPQRRSTDA